MQQHLENFLNLASSFKGEYTLKFFKRDDMTAQNSVQVDVSKRIIMDMKISDKEIFDKIAEHFGDKNEEEKETISLRENIDLEEFIDTIVDIKEHALIGFVANIKWADEKKILHAPGSQVLTYTIA
jgi:hypothetical protein